MCRWMPTAPGDRPERRKQSSCDRSKAWAAARCSAQHQELRFEVAGLRCESGSKLRAGFVAAQDAPLVTRLRQAGAIILGVTNAPELLMAWETDNLLYGRTNNPWDLERTPGGSSGGEAAAIASRHVSRRSRQRRWRIDPRAGALQWNLRAEAYSRPHTGNRTLSRLGGAFRFDRCGWPDGPNGR